MSYSGGFDVAKKVPHPFEPEETITLGQLKSIQNELKKRLNLTRPIKEDTIKYVAGIDIGHHKVDETKAKVVITIFDYQTMTEVHRDELEVTLIFPYVSGFLGFREVEHFINLLLKVKQEKPEYYPDIILVDGNGLLHHHSFGSACHLGVACGIPSIGVAKTLYCIDGLKEETYKDKKEVGEYVDLVGESGKTWGRALWNSEGASNCIFVSQGNLITLDDAIKIVLKCSVNRIPEPIRHADLMSKKFEEDSKK